MLYQTDYGISARSTGAQYSISFDASTEKFNESFPIILQQRIHPQNFTETLNTCSKIMKEHMDKIQPRKLMQLLVILITCFCTLALIAAPLLIFFLVYIDSPEPIEGIVSLFNS